MKRGHISKETKLASALLALGQVPYEDAKRMTAAQIISLFQFDHGILHAIGGPDDFWNLRPTLIALHRAKSREDAGTVAKVKRLSHITDEVQRILLKPAGHKRPRSPRWPQGRKLRSRGFRKREER